METNLHSADVPTLRDRWIGATPLFLAFAVLAFSLRNFATFKQMLLSLRIELPLPTRFALFSGQAVLDCYFLVMPVMFLLTWLHFGWAAKTRGRLLIANQTWFLFFVLVFLCFSIGLHVAFFKISTSWRNL